MDATTLVLSSVFSLLGMAAFVYGRRRRIAAPTFGGMALMVYPYFVTGTAALVAIGVLLIVAMVIGGRMEDGF